jgi:hypothetical protein
MADDVHRPFSRAAEDEVEGAFGGVDAGDLFACWAVDEDLAVGDLDVAAGVDGNTLRRGGRRAASLLAWRRREAWPCR